MALEHSKAGPEQYINSLPGWEGQEAAEETTSEKTPPCTKATDLSQAWGLWGTIVQTDLLQSTETQESEPHGGGDWAEPIANRTGVSVV